ncbi:Ribosome maturation protein SDO1, partial [Dictyocoela roeselum]
MFTPLNIKKLTNVSIVTLKKFGRKYELALYPNKFYEFQNGMTSDLDTILHTRTIFSSVSKGEICSKKDLKCFDMSEDKIIEYILRHGTEQKSSKTRNVEMQAIERQIVEYLSKKLLFDGKMVSREKLRDAVRKRTIQTKRDPKVQAQDIIKELCKEGYEVVPLIIKIRNYNAFHDELEKYEIKNGLVEMKWSDFREFKKMANKRKIF